MGILPNSASNVALDMSSPADLHRQRKFVVEFGDDPARNKAQTAALELDQAADRMEKAHRKFGV